MLIPLLILIRFLLTPTSTRLRLFAEIGTPLTTTRSIFEWYVIARTELAFLFLNERIIQMHIVLNSRYILMAENLLQTENVAAEHEITHREGVSEDVRANTLP